MFCVSDWGVRSAQKKREAEPVEFIGPSPRGL